MLSNYMWNEQLSLRFARLAKSIRPETLVVMGGPNIFLEDERQREYMRSHPELDVYVLGEGDFLAAEVVRQFLAAGKSIREFRGARAAVLALPPTRRGGGLRTRCGRDAGASTRSLRPGCPASSTSSSTASSLP